MNYDLDTYLDALHHFRDYADQLDTAMGTAYLIKKDIFKNLMWYVLPNNTKHYPLTIQRVKEIKRLNQQGQKVDELQPVEVTSSKPKEVEPAFVDVVGQISLRSLERNDKRRKDQQRNDRRGGQDQGNKSQGNRSQGGQQQASKPQGNREQGHNRPQQGGTRPQANRPQES